MVAVVTRFPGLLKANLMAAVVFKIYGIRNKLAMCTLWTGASIIEAYDTNSMIKPQTYMFKLYFSRDSRNKYIQSKM